MSVYNDFRFIGICYGDSKKVVKNQNTNEYYTELTLVIKSTVNINKPQYVPLRFTGKLAERASVMCRNGDLVSVAGEIVSRELFNRATGETQIQLFFIANDLMVNKKAYKRRLSSKTFSDLIDVFSPDEFEAPKDKKGKLKYLPKEVKGNEKK